MADPCMTVLLARCTYELRGVLSCLVWSFPSQSLVYGSLAKGLLKLSYTSRNRLSPDCSVWGLGFLGFGTDICGPRVSLTSVWSINIYIIYISIVSIYLSIYPSILSIYLIYLHHIDLSMLSIDLSYWSIHLSYMSIYLSYLSIVSIYRIYLSYLSILSNILYIYLSIV